MDDKQQLSERIVQKMWLFNETHALQLLYERRIPTPRTSPNPAAPRSTPERRKV